MNIKKLNDKLREYRDLKSFLLSKPKRLNYIYVNIDKVKIFLEDKIENTTAKCTRISNDKIKEIIRILTSVTTELETYRDDELNCQANQILVDKVKQLEETPIDNFEIKLREVE